MAHIVATGLEVLGCAAIVAALVGIAISLIRTTLDPDDGIHSFCRELDSGQFEDPSDRCGRR